MANTEDAPTASAPQWVHLHIPLDLDDENERRFGELFEALPNGMKTNFCKWLLVGAMPEQDADLDLLIAKSIRENRFRNTRGRPRRMEPARLRPTAGPAAVNPVSFEAPRVAISAVDGGNAGRTERTEKAGLAEFSDLAGGAGWEPK